MPERHLDWLRQARLDLDHARLAAREGHPEWAVFAAQQAAEKACKALHMSREGIFSTGPGGSTSITSRRATRTASPRVRHGITTPRARP